MRTLFLALLIYLTGLTGCGGKDSVASYSPEVEAESTPVGTYSSMRPTIYYLPRIDMSAEQCPSSKLQDVRNSYGQSIIVLCDRSYKTCLMQGTCLIIQNGNTRLLNYAGTKNGQRTFRFTDRSVCPYGYGVSRVCLDPFFSVAADLKYHKVGDVIFVTKLRGMALPDGRVHDGYVVIRDTGGNIRGADRFDFFTGEAKHNDPQNPMFRLGLSDKRNHFQFTKADMRISRKIRENRLYPRAGK